MSSRFVALLFVSLFSISAFAETYYLRPAKSESLSKEELASVNELLRMAVGSVEGAQLTSDEATAGAVLEPKVLKLGTAYVLGLSKIKNGQTTFSQQARAKSFEDMDTVATRVARATIQEMKFESDTRVSDVTEDQVTRGKRRIETTKQWFFGIGPGGGSNINTGKTGYYWHIGRSWGLDSHWALNLGLEVLNIKDTSALTNNFYIGADYHFNDYNSTPYVSAGFGFGGAIADDKDPSFLGISDDRASGFSGSVGGGFKFFRASTVNLGLGARYTMIFDKTSQGNPSTLSGAVTIYF